MHYGRGFTITIYDLIECVMIKAEKKSKVQILILKSTRKRMQKISDVDFIVCRFF